METPILQPGTNFLNPYEKAYAVLKKTNPQFDDLVWNKVISGASVNTDADTYIAALEKIKNIDPAQLSATYNLEHADWNTKLMAQLNEAYKDDLVGKVNKRERYKLDETGEVMMKDGKPETEQYDISDYDYYKNLIREQGKINYEKYLYEQEKERKESMSNFTKFMAGMAGTLGHVVSGFTKEVDGVANFFEGIAAGVDATFRGESFQKGMADHIISQDASKEWGTQLENALIDFEKRYTNLRDMDGNLSGAGKFFVSLADSFGQMAPAMIVTAATGGIGGALGGVAGQVISKGIPIISQTMFYSGITANQAREMYQTFASEGVTVPTEDILTNAEMKAVGQAAVEIMLGRMMGGSVLDNLTYGRSMSNKFLNNNSFVTKGLSRLAHDFIEEGSEEVLQEFSDYFVDKIWQSVPNSNWGQFADITPENLGLSFVIGGISSFIGSATRIITTPNMKIATGVDEKGNVTYKTLGKGIVGKIASYEYGVTLQEAISNVNKIIEHRQRIYDAVSKTNLLAEKFNSLKTDVATKEFGREFGWSQRDLDKADVALTQAYAGYRMLASIYEEVGPERFNAANDLLIFGSKNNDSSFYNRSADMLLNSLKQLNSVVGQKIVTKNGKEKYVAVHANHFRDLIIARRMGNIKEILNRNDENLSPEVQSLFDKHKKVNNIIVTDKGTGAVETADGTVIVSSPELNNAGAEVVIADLCEQKLVDIVLDRLENSTNLLGLRQIREWYKEIYNTEPSDINVANKLCFDDKFFRVCLFKANRESLNFLSELIDDLSKIEVKSFSDGVFKKKYTRMIDMMKSTLKQALIYNFRSDLQQIPDAIISQKEKKEILKERWSQNLLYRVVNEHKNLTDDDRRKIILTINNMTVLSDKKRGELVKQVFSVNPEERVSATNEMRDYFDAYRSMYDGTKYMPENSVPGIVFNYFLKNKGIFIDNIGIENNLTKSDLAYMQQYKLNVVQYRQHQFSEFCNGQYYFEYSTVNPLNIRQRNNVFIYETRTNKLVGVNHYISKMNSGLDIAKSKLTTVTELSKDIKNMVRDFVVDSLTDEQKSNITIRDLIFDYGLLSDKVVADMLQKFGLRSIKELTPQLKYSYFRSYIPTVLDNVSINITPDGDILFVNYRPYKQAINNFNRYDLKNGTYLAAFFKQKYLIGKLSDTVIKIDNNRVKTMSYSSKDNVVYVNSRYVKSKSDPELAYALSHELQHGIADVNGLNSGFTEEISKTIKDKAFLRKMILDVKTHVPDLFIDSKNIEDKARREKSEIDVFNKFMYLCSGETLAYGQEFTDLVTFYPVLIERKSGRCSVTMPWGSTYNFETETADLMLQKKGYLIYDVLKTGTTEISKDDYFANDLTNAFIVNGNIYSCETDAYQNMNEKLDMYFRNVPDTALENSVVSIITHDDQVQIIADASVMYNEDNTTSTLIYEIIKHAVTNGYNVAFQDKTDSFIYSELDLSKDSSIEYIADAIANIYEQAIDDEQFSQDDFMPDDSLEEISIRVPTVNAKPKRAYNKQNLENKYVKKLYHGSTEYFDKFTIGDLGFHFGTKNQAEGRQNGATTRNQSDDYHVNEYNVKIKNPFVIEEDMINWSTYNLALECLFDTDTTLLNEFVEQYKNNDVPKEKFNELVEKVKERLNKYDNKAPQEFYERLTDLFIKTVLKTDTKAYHQSLKEYKAKYFDSQKDFKDYERKFLTNALDENEKFTDKYRDLKKLEKKNYESYEHISQKKLRDIFKMFGFDAVQYKNEFEGETPEYSYIVFDNSQISPSSDIVSKNRYITDKQRETFESLKRVRSKQLSPELQTFYIGAERNPNIAPELRDEVMKGTLRWSTDKTDKMSISRYLRTASDINQDTFDLINKSFFKNKNIKSFDELKTLIAQVGDIYAVSALFENEGQLGVLSETGIDFVKDYITLLNSQLGTDKGKERLDLYNKLAQKYARMIDRGIWTPGGNDGYYRLNFMKYYDGSILSVYQFAKELAGIVGSKYNSIKLGQTSGKLQTKKGDTEDVDEVEDKIANKTDVYEADVFGSALRAFFETHKYTTFNVESLIDELYPAWSNKSKWTLFALHKFYSDIASISNELFDEEKMEKLLARIYNTEKFKLDSISNPKTKQLFANARRFLVPALSSDDVFYLTQKYGPNAFNDKKSFMDISTGINEVISDSMAFDFMNGNDDDVTLENILYSWVDNFKAEKELDAFLNKLNAHYDLINEQMEAARKEQFNKILSGKELREPANIVRSIQYYFRKLGTDVTPKAAKLLATNNPDLFVYDESNNQLSLNEDAYLVKTESYKMVKDPKTGEPIKKDTVLTAYKLTPELKNARNKIKDVVNAYLLGAYNNERALKSFNEAFAKYEKKVRKIYDNFKSTAGESGKQSKQKIVTYNINEREYNVEGDGDMPTIIYDMMKSQNEDVDVRKSRVQFLSDDDDAHIVASFKNFNKENVEYLESLTQNDVEEIIAFYLTHAILSDKWSTDFETVRTGLLGYILRMSNAFDDLANPRFVLSNDVIDKIESLLRFQASKGGQYLRLQRSLLSQVRPLEDFAQAISDKYAFKISEEQTSALADAINSGDINRVGELKSEIIVDLISQNRAKKTYNKFIKILSKFVEKDFANNDFAKFVEELDKKIADESKYGDTGHLYKRLNSLKKSLQDMQDNGVKYVKLDDKQMKYLSDHTRLISEGYFNENNAVNSIFKSYDAYKNAYYSYRVESKAGTLNDYFSVQYKNTDSFLDKLWNWERAMMLTSPGTWVRNQVSDIVLHTTNRVSDGLIALGDKLFSKSKKWHREGQYKIAGTKVISNDIKDFVDKLTDKKQENNIFSQINDAINKYDARKIPDNSPDMNLAELIVNKLASDVSRGDIPFDKLGIKDERGRVEKAIAKSKKFLFKMLSDSTWIKIEFKRVLARMLTEENIDMETETKKGLSNKVQSIIAEAYTFAAQTYMHKGNFMNKFDDLIRQKAGPVGYFMWKQIFPFASASWNWFMEGLSYSPIGLAKGIVNLIKLDNTIQKLDAARQKGEPVVSSKFAEYLAKRQIGHGIIGSFGFIAGCLLVAFGKAGLDEEDGKYKLKVGDLMIDISDVFGTNGLLVGMSFTQACQENSGDNWFDNFMYVINTVMNQIVLENSFSDLFNTLRYNKNLGDFMTTMGVYTIPSMFIPNFLKSLSGLFGKFKVKYASGVAGKLERLGFQIAPYLTLLDSVPKYIDPYTGEKQIALNIGWFEEDWLIPSIINKYGPIDFKPYNVSKYEKEALELGIKKSMLTGNYKVDNTSINISGKSLESLNKYYGRLNQSMLEPLFDDRIRVNVQTSNGTYKMLKYSQMSDAQKKNAIENIMEKNARYSEVYALTSNYGYKYFATESEYLALKKLGITDNVYRANNKYKGFVKK